MTDEPRTGDGIADDVDDLDAADDGPPLTSAEEAALARLESDLERVLGPEVGIGALELDPGGPPIRVRATLMTEGKVREIEAEGDDLDAACAALLRAASVAEGDTGLSRIIGDF